MRQLISKGAPHPRANSLASYAATVLVCCFASGLCWLLYGRVAFANLVMVYLLGVAIVSTAFGPREAVLSSLLSLLLLNFFFVPPRFTLSVADAQYVITFIVMLAVALLISSLTQTLRAHMEAAESREERTATLLELSRKLSRSRSKKEIAEAVLASVQAVCPCEAVVYLQEGEKLLPILETRPRAGSRDIAERAFHAKAKIKGEEGFVYLPIQATGNPVGVIAVQQKAEKTLDQRQEDLLSAFANQTAVALERAILAKQSHEANLQIETERLRNALLSSVSHDLRTPLTSILGASSSLLQEDLPADKRRDLLGTIQDESGRLDRLVRNLLDMTRLESGHLELRLEWNSLEELIGSAISRTEALLGDRKVSVQIPESIPLVEVDGVLIEQVFVNLLENAARHTPPGTEIHIGASLESPFVRVEICDNGPGFPTGEEDKAFEKFHRGKRTAVGTGLGLTICRAILKAHGSQIWARNNPGGGANIVFELRANAAPAPPDE